MEETGYVYRLLPVNMFSRAPLAAEVAEYGDVARYYTDLVEAFNVQVRQYGGLVMVVSK